MDFHFDPKNDIPNLAVDEMGYIVNGIHCAAVRLTRASGAAASMFAITACAFAVQPNGDPILTAELKIIEGQHSASCPKTDLITNGELDQAKVEALRNQAIGNALQEMVSLILAEAAFNQIGA